MRVLTSPAETGAVTLALPQDVQAEAYDYPEELFEKRVWLIRATAARHRLASAAAVEAIAAQPRAHHRRGWRRPVQRGLAGARRLRLTDRHPGRRNARRARARCRYDHPQNVGAIGVDRHAGGQSPGAATPTS